jgi:hypothetical protein
MTVIRERLARVPGVMSAGVVTEGAERAPMIMLRPSQFTTDGMRSAQIRPLYVSLGYFPALGLPVTRGRAFSADDDKAGSSTVVVNAAAAAALWPGENPIGKRLARGTGDGRHSTSLEVIGVVGPAPYEGSQPAPMIYAPLSTAASGWNATIVVRTRRDARASLPQLRGAIKEVEPYLALGGITTLAEQYEGERREAVESNAAALAVGAVALVLASIGLYAIIAFAVVQRTREIGVRLAMGATPGRVVREFFNNGIRLSAIGLAIGLPATVVGIQLVKASVLGFTIRNVAAVLVVIPVLIVVAGLASWLPARRAGRVDPLIALRAE